MENENKNSNAETAVFFGRGLVPYTDREIANLAGNVRIKIARNASDIRRFIDDAIALKNRGEKLLVGKIGDALNAKIKDDTGVDLRRYNLELRSDEIRHLIKEHGDDKKESPRGQRAICADDVFRFADIVTNYDEVAVERDNGLHFKKGINGKVTAVAVHAKKNKSLSLHTMYAGISDKRQ